MNSERNETTTTNTPSNISTNNNTNESSESIILVDQEKINNRQSLHNDIINKQIQLHKNNNLLHSITCEIRELEFEQIEEKTHLDELTSTLLDWKENKRQVHSADHSERDQRRQYIIETLENKVVAQLVQSTKSSEKLQRLKNKFDIQQLKVNILKDEVKEITKQIIFFKYSEN